MRPRYNTGEHQNNAGPVSASDQANLVSVPTAQQQPFSVKVDLDTPPVRSLDFVAGAKAYKKSRTRSGILRGLKVAGVMSAVTVMALGGFGFWLNNKYAGRALPFSYIGDVSVGGLTQPEIKAALDNHVKDLKITFVDGGLTRTVPASQFGAKFDTDAVSRQIIPDFNPFAFLDRRSLQVPVKINDYQVDGYLRINVHPGQTKPNDAQIVKDKTKLVVKPQTFGFRTDPAFVADNIRTSLAELKNPQINVNAVSLKPRIFDTDLSDDVAKANKLLSTNVSIAYGRTMNVITPAQKLSWIEFGTSYGTKDVRVSFSRSQIRQFVIDLAKKYQTPTTVAPVAQTATADPAAPTDPAATLAPQTIAVIDNIEEVVDAIVSGLNNGQATASKFVASKSQSTQPVTSTVTPANVVASRP